MYFDVNQNVTKMTFDFMHVLNFLLDHIRVGLEIRAMFTSKRLEKKKKIEKNPQRENMRIM